LIEIGSKTAEKNSAQANRQTDKQTDRHYENNGHLAVNQKSHHIETTDTGLDDLCIREITVYHTNFMYYKIYNT